MISYTHSGDSIEREFIFIYECPFCNTVSKIRVPLKGVKLNAKLGITCEKCAKFSQISENMNRISKVSRYLSIINDSDLENHTTKVFIDALAASAAAIIKPQNITEREGISVFKEYCQVNFNSCDNMAYAKDRLKFYLNYPSIRYLAIKKFRYFDKDAKTELLSFLCEIATANGTLDDNKISIMEQLVQDLLLPSEMWQSIKDKFINNQGVDDVYVTLGISKDASFSEIKSAYYKKCQEFHPDKYQSLPISFQNFASDNFKKVNEAYKKLSQMYGN